ncbi:unnamed protein product [Sphagnum balticum]
MVLRRTSSGRTTTRRAQDGKAQDIRAQDGNTMTQAVTPTMMYARWQYDDVSNDVCRPQYVSTMTQAVTSAMTYAGRRTDGRKFVDGSPWDGNRHRNVRGHHAAARP